MEQENSHSEHSPKRERGCPRTIRGIVTSHCRDKTITVEVRTFKRHPKYGRFVRAQARYHAHDEKNACQSGDEVILVESRPTSRLKRWRLRRIVARAAREV